MVKSSNEKRGLLKQQCQEALAAYIHDRLGLVVAPGQVRLQPPPEDGLLVEVAPEQRDGGSVPDYQQRARSLARACLAAGPQGPQSGPRAEGKVAAERTNRDGELDVSFTAKLHSLECANHSLSLELDRTRTRLENLVVKGVVFGPRFAHSKPN
ncbi:uncharacterized protein N7473_004327 [Penicillium subrubescens]|uniref:uncharacterized protein n=1 Tax=Penicillium subrubescens TaxID=1316194 RepID=UPI0025450E72|nr:uncharacterized protein N7473_004327 [Penicillium subrubescens]KAJ5900257.1 hypothetical protein N7473_004327 [Penicillium subrubescens]